MPNSSHILFYLTLTTILLYRTQGIEGEGGWVSPLEVRGGVYLAENLVHPTCTGQLPQREGGGESEKTRGARARTGWGRDGKGASRAMTEQGLFWPWELGKSCVFHLQTPLLAGKCPLLPRSRSRNRKGPFKSCPSWPCLPPS